VDRWLTPQSAAPTAQYCRRLLIPQEVDWLIPFVGALSELGKVHNWQQSDMGQTPEDTAAKMREIIDAWSEDMCMIGVIFIHAASQAPSGSLPCDGATHNRSDYPDLFDHLDAAYHVGSTQFKTPDLRGRTVVGDGTGAGLTNRPFATPFGEETHVLTVGELATHTHVQLNHNHANFQAAGANVTTIGAGAPQATAVPVVGAVGNNAGVNQNTGSNTAHNNMQPSLPLHYAIWAK
jgi:microcystin-dependent protein